MIKRLSFLIILLLLLSSLNLFSIGFITVDSDEWKVANALCISNGVLPPSTVSPLSTNELLSAIEKIPFEKLDVKERQIIEKLTFTLQPDPILKGKYVSINPSISFTPEIYLQTKPVPRQYDYAFGIKDSSSFMPLSLDFYLGDKLYAFADYIFLSPALKNQFDKTFGTNLDSKNDFQHEGIFNCGIAFINDFLYTGIFRTRQSMGNGKTGNLIVSDNFSRQDFLRFHFDSEFFSYTLNLTHFDQSNPSNDIQNVTLSNNKFNGMHQVQGVHRAECKFFDKVKFVFQEGVILNSTSSFDFRLLNPFIYFHGLYNFSESQNYNPGFSSDEANNYTALELTVVGVPHLAFNMQFLMDQIQLGGERIGRDACPQAFGLLINFESPFVFENYYLNSWFEIVSIMPYTYLNLKILNDGRYDSNLDMITGYHNSNQDEISIAGYKAGGDSLTFALGFDFAHLAHYSISTSFVYLIHGQYGYNYKTIIPERGDEHIADMPFTGIGIENAEHRLTSNLNFSWYEKKGLKIDCGISHLHVLNYRCEKGKTLSSFQLKFGITINPIEMFL